MLISVIHTRNLAPFVFTVFSSPIIVCLYYPAREIFVGFLKIIIGYHGEHNYAALKTTAAKISYFDISLTLR